MAGQLQCNNEEIDMPKSKYKMPNEGSGMSKMPRGGNRGSSGGGGMKANHGAGNNRKQTYMAGLGKGDSRRMRMGTNTGASTGVRKSNEMRSDMTGPISNHNPYPHGLA